MEKILTTKEYLDMKDYLEKCKESESQIEFLDKEIEKLTEKFNKSLEPFLKKKG